MVVVVYGYFEKSVLTKVYIILYWRINKFPLPFKLMIYNGSSSINWANLRCRTVCNIGNTGGSPYGKDSFEYKIWWMVCELKLDKKN